MFILCAFIEIAVAFNAHNIYLISIKLFCLLAEESKNDANDNKHQCHANKNADHRRINVSEAGFLFDFGWKQIDQFAWRTRKDPAQILWKSYFSEIF